MGQHLHDFANATIMPPGEDHDASAGTGDCALVVDIDRAITKVLLFDLVDGTPRFIASSTSRSTALPPYGDPAIGVGLALADLEAQTGRKLLDKDQLISPQQPNGDGVDVVIVTGAPASPVPVAVVGVGSPSLSSALVAAARRVPALVADAAADLPAESMRSVPTLQQWLQSVQPTTVVLVSEGGSNDDWSAVLDAVRDVAADGGISQGIVVADTARQQSAATAAGAALTLSGIDPAEYDAREITTALEVELRDQYLARVEAANPPRMLATAAFVDRIQATQAVTAFLHRRMNRSVLSVGASDGALLSGALRSGASLVLRADLDLHLAARNLLRIAPERITRWLPFRAAADEVVEWVLNRALRPSTEPASVSDSLISAALSRELLATLRADAGMASAPDADLIAAGGSLVGSDRPLALLTLLDGLSPAPADGVVVVALDVEGLAAPLGALATHDPVYACEVLDHDFLTPLASCVVVTGEGADGVLAVRGEIRYAGGESSRFSVPYGSLHRLPLPEGEAASLTLEPEPGFAIGRKPAGEPSTFEGEHQIFGGELGVVIDARGRPVGLPTDPEVRVARLKSWMTDLGGRVD